MLRVDVVFGITEMSMAHSRARKAANDAGVRYLSLPAYSEDVLAGAALQADFRALTALADRLANRLSDGSRLRITSLAGTDLECDIRGRHGNSAPGWCVRAGTIASPPDAEANIAPVEGTANGIIVVDGSIPAPGLGLLRAPLRIVVRDGVVFEIAGLDSECLRHLFASAGDDRALLLAEVGIGLNPLARLCGVMLEDEGCAGTVHFGFGSNTTLGGVNDVPFHLDHVVRAGRIWCDGQMLEIDHEMQGPR